MLVVGIETVTDKFRFKYPNPNLTLQAGSIEKGETHLNTRLAMAWTTLLICGTFFMNRSRMTGRIKHFE